jgi:hypothetical protein
MGKELWFASFLNRRIFERPKRKIGDNIKMDNRKIRYEKGRGWNSLRGRINCELAYFWRFFIFKGRIN